MFCDWYRVRDPYCFYRTACGEEYGSPTPPAVCICGREVEVRC